MQFETFSPFSFDFWFGSFPSMVFHFQNSGFSQILTLSLISNWLLCTQRTYFVWLKYFMFFETYFMTQNIFHPDKYLISTWRECDPPVVGEVLSLTFDEEKDKVEHFYPLLGENRPSMPHQYVWYSPHSALKYLCLVAQSCPTLCDHMDCRLPGSSVHRDFPGQNTGVGCHALLQGIFPTQGLNPGLPYCG